MNTRNKEQTVPQENDNLLEVRHLKKYFPIRSSFF